MKARVLIARNVRRLRVERDISQEALALDAGIDRTYMSRLEREGEAENPSLSVLESLASVLKVDIRELFEPRGASSKVKPMRGGRKPRA